MDMQTIFQDASIIASVSTAIFFVIDFVKRMYYKLPWGWIQKTPGEVWFALSILMGIGVAIGVFWDNFFSGSATLTTGLSSAAYGLVAGAGSKFINAVASTAGAKLKASKEEALAKAESNTKPQTVESAADVTNVPPDIIMEAATPTLQDRIEITKDKIDEKIKEPTVELVKKVVPEGDYVIIDGNVYKITKGGE
jgi:uncharacterized protein (DUF697 family)